MLIRVSFNINAHEFSMNYFRRTHVILMNYFLTTIDCVD